MIFRFTLLFLILSFSSFCLQKKHSPYTDYNLNQTLRYPTWAEPPTLDWNKAFDVTSSLVIKNIMKGLLEYNHSKKNLELQGALAQSWSSDKQHKTWIFKLRTNVKWNDGVPLTAQHFIDSWQRLLDPKSGASYAYFLFPIKNAKAYHQGKIKNFNQVGVQVSSSGELLINLEKGLSYFPYLFTHSSTFPIRKDIIKKYGSLWTEPNHIVTLGAYNLFRWDHDKALILKKNNQFYGHPPFIEKVILYIISEESTALNLYLSGRLDVVTKVPSRQLKKLQQRKDYKQNQILSLYYYGFNIKKKSVQDVIIRKAIAHSIDRKEILKVLNTHQQPLKSWIKKGLFAYNPNVGLDFNPQKAKALLKKEGYGVNKPLPKIKLSYNTNADHKIIAANVQAQLKKNINLEIELDNQEWKTYLQRLKTGTAEMFRLGWFADYPDPANFMNILTSTSENNYTQWKNKKFDELVKKAMLKPNNFKRKNLYDQAQKILLEQAVPVIPFFSYTNHLLVSKRLKNFPINMMGDVHFEKIKIKQKGALK